MAEFIEDAIADRRAKAADIRARLAPANSGGAIIHDRAAALLERVQSGEVVTAEARALASIKLERKHGGGFRCPLHCHCHLVLWFKTDAVAHADGCQWVRSRAAVANAESSNEVL